MNIYLESDERILDAALDAWGVFCLRPDHLPRCEEEDALFTENALTFFSEWLTDEVADFYPDGFSDDEDLRAVGLADAFVDLALEDLRDLVDFRQTLESLPR